MPLILSESDTLSDKECFCFSFLNPYNLVWGLAKELGLYRAKVDFSEVDISKKLWKCQKSQKWLTKTVINPIRPRTITAELVLIDSVPKNL